jgi:hypothetical protein
MKSAMRLRPVLIVAAILLTGCVSSGGGTECAGWRAIRLDDASIDGLTDRDARAVLAHNEYGRARGCWHATSH